MVVLITVLRYRVLCDIIGSLCSKFGDDWFIFKKVKAYNKKIDGPKFADPSIAAVSP